MNHRIYRFLGLGFGLALTASAILFALPVLHVPASVVFPLIVASFLAAVMFAPLFFGGLTRLEAVVKGTALLMARDRAYRQRWLVRALA